MTPAPTIGDRSCLLLRTGLLPLAYLNAATRRELTPGQTLCRRGDSTDVIFVVESGRLRLTSTTSDGRVVPLHLIRGGEYVSEAALFADSYCGDVIAESHSRVIAYPKKLILTTFHRTPHSRPKSCND
jgi:CRP-like cAMP-binding protein